jgi:hypothetical protein
MFTWWDLGEGSGYQGTDLATHRLTCAFCNTQGNFSLAHRESKQHASNKHKVLYFDTLKCGNCSNFLMAFWSAGGGVFGRGLHDYKTVPWALGGPDSVPAAWPSEVGRFWQQASRALGRGDLDAASVMARSALQMTLRAKEVKGHSLRDEIDDLAGRGLLPLIMKEWAHELRLLGNSSAHPRLADDPPDQKDVRDVTEFLEYLLSYLYTWPNRIEEYRGRKEGRTDGVGT